MTEGMISTKPGQHEADEAAQKMSNLLKLVGNPANCGRPERPGCNQLIYWVATNKGKRMPVNPDGTPHWATCPKAAEFRRTQNRERRG